jgi:alkanesulfonate monooxygenase SsuD/methylene tetrahydromethanopterin reductase-like flavin-dependent oxidoreductase (luciferase family)
MRLGIHMPLLGADGNPLNAAGVMARARAIEAAGFEGIWIGDGLGAMARPDPLMWLLVAAAATDHIEVGTSILQVPLRNPVELAQRFLTLHALTEGRFSVGVGSGSGKAGFDAIGSGEAFPNRFRLLSEYLSVIRRLCNGEQVGEANLHPWPSTLGGPPIIIGAWSSEIWLRRAARDYDGWMCSGSFNRSKARGDESTLATLAANIKRYRDMGGKRALVSTVPIDLSEPEKHLAEDEPFNLHCGPESAADRLARLAKIGFDDVLLVKRDSSRRLSLYEADLSEEDLTAIRGLLPKQAREPAAVSRGSHIPR